MFDDERFDEDERRFHDDDERMTIDFAPLPPLSLLGVIGSSDSIRMWGGYFFVEEKKKGVERDMGSSSRIWDKHNAQTIE